VGPITRTVEDAALVLTALAGHDPRDPASLATAAVDYRPGAGTDLTDLTGLRIGLRRTYYFDHVDAEVETAVRHAIGQLEALGARLVEVDIPLTRYLQATQWGLMVPEATAYHEATLRSVPELYQADVRILLEAGGLMTAGDYLRAQRSRTLMSAQWTRMLKEVDVIAAPTVPMTAVRADEETVTWPDGTVENVSDAYVRLSAPANITGVPALSVPVGHDLAGMPICMQLLAMPLRERTLLRVGHAYEQTQPARALAPVA
jgi:aspartyl-tRNA(Asn)/glutamyl-tRNA(Gln) amidotransferase subunit A